MKASTQKNDWRIDQGEWKAYEVRFCVPLPIARPRSRPPKPMQLVLSLAGLKEFRARVDRVIQEAEQHPQEVAKRGGVQKKTPPKIPKALIRPGLVWGTGNGHLFAYAAVAADLKDVPDEIDGVCVLKRITGRVRPARAR